MRVVATQPRSILFPYTTLFRSFGPDPVLDAEVTEHLDGALVGDVRARRVGGAGVLGDGYGIHAVGCQERRGGKPGRDRKSTRLNSSHVAISYAVFCLKKKKPHI